MPVETTDGVQGEGKGKDKSMGENKAHISKSGGMTPNEGLGGTPGDFE